MKLSQANSEYDRRRFLRSLFLGSGALLLPSLLWSKNLQDNAISQSQQKELLKQARRSFYKKEFTKAETLFKQLISANPTSIVYYDGLRKVYGAQQQLYDAAYLYKDALAKNPGKAAYYDRLARSMNAIALGNRKDEVRYQKKSGDKNLLFASLALYLLAIPRFPKDKSLRLGLSDTIRCFDLRNKLTQINETLPATLRPAVQKYLDKMQDLRGRPENVASQSIVQFTTERIEHMESVERREIFFEQELLLRNEAISKQKKYWECQQLDVTLVSGNLTLSREQVEKIVREHPEETQVIGTLKKNLSATKDYANLVTFYQERTKTYKDFWSLIGYASALRKKDVRSHATEIQSLYEEAALQLPQSGKAIHAFYCGQVGFYLDTQRFTQAKQEVLKAMEITNGCGNVSLRLILYYARSLSGEGNHQTALNIVQCLKSGDTYQGVADPIVRFILPDKVADETIYQEQQLRPRSLNKEQQLDILYVMARIQKELQDTNSLQQTLTKIRTIDPENVFARKFS